VEKERRDIEESAHIWHDDEGEINALPADGGILMCQFSINSI